MTNPKPILLSLDLGTSTGWAIRNEYGRIVSGTASFKPRRFEGGGMRYLRFERWLNETRNVSGRITKRNEILVKLMNAIGDLNLGNYGDNSIDLFGDAYEYLMTMYAANAGKSGGEFFTPQEVSELLARITVVGKTEVNKVYDPACGSGSLLLKFAKVLGKENVRNGFYGQETNITTYNLCRINSRTQFIAVHVDVIKQPAHIVFTVCAFGRCLNVLKNRFKRFIQVGIGGSLLTDVIKQLARMNKEAFFFKNEFTAMLGFLVFKFGIAETFLASFPLLFIDVGGQVFGDKAIE